MNDSARLRAKSVKILQAIAGGWGYEQILRAYPSFTYNDIFQAARDALDRLGLEDGDRRDPDTPAPGRAGSTDGEERIRAIKQKHPRAYERWSEEEEAELRRLVAAGRSAKAIAAMMERQPSAIRSRISKLGLPDVSGSD